ncbi:MAG: hypothetical protein MPW17_11315 [Candidatus Manganitrophus sp.]|nr:hypothetical protein [Candidatus Manganitrophus sp.]WDT69381.1 MAG: hypothetical protein MPW17_11315 [Candidatus Manganitrophus sp.]
MSLKIAGSGGRRVVSQADGALPPEKTSADQSRAPRSISRPKRLPNAGSITAKLTFLFSLSAFVIFGAAALFFNWVVERNLHNEDNQFLADKIHVLRRILQERPDDLDFLRAEAEWEVAARQFVPYYVRVLDDQMRTVIETPEMGGRVPSSAFPPAVGAT